MKMVCNDIGGADLWVYNDLFCASGGKVGSSYNEAAFADFKNHRCVAESDGTYFKIVPGSDLTYPSCPSDASGASPGEPDKLFLSVCLFVCLASSV